MDSINELSRDLYNFLIFRTIHLKEPHEVSRYLDLAGISPDEICGEIDLFQKFLSETRAMVVQSNASSTNTQVDKPAGASLVYVPKSDTSESSEAGNDLSYHAGSSSQHKSVKKRKLEADAQPTLVTSAHTPKLVEHQPDHQEPTSSKKDISRLSQQGGRPVKKKRVPTEITMDWPHTINVLVDNIKNKMKHLRELKNVSPKELKHCWYDLISGDYGDAIKELLITLVVSDRPESQLSKLQKRMVDSGVIELPGGEKEAAINNQQSMELKTYLAECVFNGRFVAFQFYELCDFIKKKNKERECYNLPDRLYWLGDEIRRLVNCAYYEKGIVLNCDECWQKISKSRLNKQIIDLMSVISLADSDRVDELMDLQKKLHVVIEKKLRFVDSSFDGKDENITSQQADNFYTYLKNVCFSRGLVKNNFDEFRKYLTSMDDNSEIDNDEEMSF